MTSFEIVQLARKIAATVRDGLRRAFHYLRSLGFSAREQCEALAGA